MFRKITSNRDPGATLWSELRGEFGAYFHRAGAFMRVVCKGNPKTVFSLMLAFLLFSAVLSFTLFRHPPPPAKPAINIKTAPAIDDGFGRILDAGATLQQTLHLKAEVEIILARDKLSHPDSLALEHALDSLQLLQHQIH
jgi:hypothetical protein